MSFLSSSSFLLIDVIPLIEVNWGGQRLGFMLVLSALALSQRDATKTLRVAGNVSPGLTHCPF